MEIYTTDIFSNWAQAIEVNLSQSNLTFLYQVENLDIKNRLPPPPLSQEDLEQVFLREENPGLVLDQMVRGTFTLQDTQQEQEGFFP